MRVFASSVSPNSSILCISFTSFTVYWVHFARFFLSACIVFLRGGGSGGTELNLTLLCNQFGQFGQLGLYRVVEGGTVLVGPIADSYLCYSTNSVGSTNSSNWFTGSADASQSVKSDQPVQSVQSVWPIGPFRPV